MRFEKILVIGSGKIATDCVRILCSDLELKCVEGIESSDSQFSMLKSVCGKFGLPYRMICKKSCITEDIVKLSKEGRLLIISANNRYLFPEEICELGNVEIINFHYGYLPRYRGMNIPTWVIYNHEPYTGVTWHYVTSEVDRGEIIAQEKIALDEKITAYEVVRDGMRIGTELFQSFIADLLQKRIDGKKILTDEYVYLNRNIPEDGILNLDRGIEKIYRLLRSYDYGRAGTLQPLRVYWDGKVYFVVSYSLKDSEMIERSLKVEEGLFVISENKKTLTVGVRKGDEKSSYER